MLSRWHDPLGLIAFFVLAATAGAIIAWPLWLLTGFPWDRVLSRSVLLCAALLLWPLFRWLSLGSDAVFGNRWQSKVFAGYWLLGFLLIVPPALVFLWSGYRVFDATWREELDDLARALLGGLLGGVVAAALEESIFRGVFLASLARAFSLRMAMTLSSALYALSHFLRTDFEVADPGFLSGFLALAQAFDPLLHPAVWWDSFLGLFALGILLCLVRLRTGSLLPCIALHAAWIFFLRVYKEMTGRDVHSEWSWLVGGHDNFTGVVVAFWLVLLIALYVRFSPVDRARVWQ